MTTTALPPTKPTLSFERFEFKYFVPERLVDAIRKFTEPYLERDEFAAREPDGIYRINNLYLDTPALAFYWAHVRGNPDRYKLRVRTYGDGRGARFLEVKRKYRSVIIKHRAMLSPAAYEALSAGDWGPTLEQTSDRYLNEFLSRAMTTGAQPVFSIRYEREAYKSVFIDDARLTFDRGICYQRATSTDLATRDADWIYVEPPSHVRAGVLIELKANDVYPWWMSELVVRFGLQRLQFSKYLTAVTHHRTLRNRDVDQWPQSVLGKLAERRPVRETVAAPVPPDESEGLATRATASVGDELDANLP